MVMEGLEELKAPGDSSAHEEEERETEEEKLDQGIRKSCLG